LVLGSGLGLSVPKRGIRLDLRLEGLRGVSGSLG